jgi:hypothetical protein
MEYELISQATGETLHLTAREWEMLRKLAAQPAGWKPNGEREYTRGSISAEEALEMAESVKRSQSQLGRGRSEEQALVAETVEELRESLGYVEEDPLTFFGDAARRRKVEDFVRLASAGGFEVRPLRRE